MKKLPLAILLAIVLAALIFAFTRYDSVNPPPALPNTAQEADTALEATYMNATADDIAVELPFPGAVTGKEFTVVGQARGPWFFEASFLVQVLDADGNQLATGIAQADGDWMTTEFVGFTAPISVPQTYIGPATLVLKNDNPSGEPERDKSISIPFTIGY